MAEPFTWPLRPETVLDTLRPRRPTATRGVVTRVVPRTDRATSIELRVGRGWQPHQPGQFVTVGVDVDGIRHHRCFSLTSPPDERRIEITVQAVDGGIVSPYLAHRVRPGEVLHLSPPAGDFTLTGDAPLLFVSGGSGITPFLGMVRSLVASGANREVTLLHHAPTPRDAIARDELAHTARTQRWLRIHTEFIAAGGRHLRRELVDGLVPDWTACHSYVCGPPGLRAAAVEIWSAAGCIDRLRVESFQPPDTAPALSGSTATMACSRSGAIVAVAPGESLLEAAERAGLRPRSGCRMGICHTCATPLRAGVAQDRRDGRTVDAGGHVQLCVSTALTDLELDL